MVTAFILMQTERGLVNEIAEKLQSISGISEVYSVSGKYDLIAIVRVSDTDSLAELVTKRMPVLTGIKKTETMLAFQSYSRHDLEAMFSLGMN